MQVRTLPGTYIGVETSPNLYGTMAFLEHDGDGFGDVCVRATQGVVCNHGSPTTYANATYVETSRMHFSNPLGADVLPSYWGTIQFPDLTGDGKGDVCMRASAGTYCAASWGRDGFGPLGAGTATNALAADSSYWTTMQYPQLDGQLGDRRADFCARFPDGLRCGLSTGTTFAAPALWDNGFFSDANGWTRSSQYETIQTADINGDGSEDVCARAPTGLFCGRSNATSFTAMVRWTDEFGDNSSTLWGSDYSYFGTIQFPDLNGDGKRDVCGRGVGGLLCGLSDGKGFQGMKLWSGEFSDSNGWNSASRAGAILFGDINADGRDDVCGRSAAGMVCALSNGSDAFTSVLRSDAFSDTSGWSMEPFWSTLAFSVADRKLADSCFSDPLHQFVRSRRRVTRLAY